MKCEKCGATISKDKLYCSFCGNEVQLVPDYNFLEDDMLSDIIQNGTAQNQKDLKGTSAKNKKHRKKSYIRSGMILLAVIMILTAFCIYGIIQNKQQNSYDYQFQKADEYFSSEDYEQAIVCYERALELRPNDKAAQNKLIDIYLLLNKDEDAISILKELLTMDKSDTESCQKLIQIYEKKQKYENIIALYEELDSTKLNKLFEDYLVEKPIFSLEPDTYAEAIEISIYYKNGQTVFYTTDGSDPIKNGQIYRDSLLLEEEGTTVIQAVVQNEKGLYSEIEKASYTVKFVPPAMPKVFPESGTYEVPQMITVEVAEGQNAYYTWDGTDPTEASEKYTQPLEMPQGNQVLSVILVDSHGLRSNVYRVNYVYMP